MVTESSILSSKVVNETRFQFFRNWNDTPGNMIPQINVSGAFVTGGNGLGNTHDLSKHFELQNNTSYRSRRANHSLRRTRAAR